MSGFIERVDIFKTGSVLTLLWVSADWSLKSTSAPSSRSLIYKKERKTNS